MAILTGCARRPPGTPRARRRQIVRTGFCALLLLAAGWTAGTAPGFAEEPPPSPYQVKAAFLINFPKYVDWPAQAFAGSNDPIVIAVLGETKVADEVEKVILGRTVNGRSLVLKRVASGGRPGVCHILFIPAAEHERSSRILAGLKDGGVLTVGESADFLVSGGIINLARRDQKIGLEVNLAAADGAGIKISSKLLNVASVVKGRPK